jgi:hypothetical protein
VQVPYRLNGKQSSTSFEDLPSAAKSKSRSTSSDLPRRWRLSGPNRSSLRLALWFVAGLRSTAAGADWRIKFWAKQESDSTSIKAVQPTKTATSAKVPQPAATSETEPQTAAQRACLQAESAQAEWRKAEALRAEARAPAEKAGKVRC